MIVYLLRHGIADDPAPGQADEHRALTDEGVARLERASAAWRRLVGPIDLLLASPLRRAQQTAEIFRRAAAAAAAITAAPDLLPSARPLCLLELLQQRQIEDCAGVAVVGHEPHLGCLLGLLLTGSERASIPLKKGMLVGVELESTASGRLIFALSQRTAGSLGK